MNCDGLNWFAPVFTEMWKSTMRSGKQIEVTHYKYVTSISSIALAIVVSEREELGLEKLSKKWSSFHPGSMWSPTLAIPDSIGCSAARGIFRCVFPSNQLHKAHRAPHRDYRCGCTQPHLLFTRAQEKGSSGGGHGYAWHGGNQGDTVFGAALWFWCPTLMGQSSSVWTRKANVVFKWQALMYYFFHSIWVAPICHPSVWFVWSFNVS